MTDEFIYTGLGDADTSDIIGGWAPKTSLADFLIGEELKMHQILADHLEKNKHYEGNGIECYQAMIAAHGKEAFKTFCLLNIQKYSWRLGKKGDPKSDMKKIADYARLWLENA